MIVDFMEVSLTYGNYNHDDGPMAHRGRLDATLPVPYFGGAARLMIDGFASEDEEEIRNGAPIEFDSFTLGGQYGRNITDWWAVGIGGYPYEKAQVDFGVGPVAGPVADPGPDIKGEALSQLGSIQLGTLFRPCDKVRIGGQIIYIIDDLEASFPGGGAHSGDYFDIHYFAIEYVP